MTSRGKRTGARCVASALAVVLTMCASSICAEVSLADSLGSAQSSLHMRPTTGWNELPDYRHERIVPWKLATAIAGVGVYDLAFYQTLKKPWWSGETSRFHVINDWWGGYALEVDKLGHAFAAQSLALISAETYQWAGMTRREALFWGGVSSLATMTQIEVLDGFTAAYGFSPADYTANIVGAFWPLAQEMWSPLNVVTFKMSYHTARFEKAVAPNVMEDYNRQTYWLAFDVNRMLPEPTRDWWPDWLGVAVGYGVTNAFTYVSHREYDALRPHRSYLVTRRPAHMMREYYVALDVDPTRLVPEHWWLHDLVRPLKYLHLPSPAIRFREDGTRFFALYF